MGFYDNTVEIWARIDGYEGYYEVSNTGKVRGLDRFLPFKNKSGGRTTKGRVLKPHDNGSGYYYVSLYLNGKKKNKLIHRLVAECYLENPHNKETVNHKDGDKGNNHVGNLEWLTQRENNAHALLNGLTPMGEDRSNSKLRDYEIEEIRRLYNSPENKGKKYLPRKYSQSNLAKMYGVSFQHISDIVNGKRRK